MSCVVCMCMWVLCVYMFVHTCLCMCVCCMCVLCVYMFVHTCMHVCVLVSVCVSVFCVCYVYTFVCIHVSGSPACRTLGNFMTMFEQRYRRSDSLYMVYVSYSDIHINSLHSVNNFISIVTLGSNLTIAVSFLLC